MASAAPAFDSSPAKTTAVLKFRTSRYNLAPGDRGIERTVKWMRGLVEGREGAPNATVRVTALNIVRDAANNDYQGQIARIFDWVKSNIEFRGEYKETLQSPLVTLEVRAGDCDDHSTIVAGLLGALGFKTRFTTVAADPAAPDAFTHVFCEVFDHSSGQWLAMDTTVAQSTVGWRPPIVFRSETWPALGSLGDAIPASGNTLSPVATAATDALRDVSAAASTALARRIQYGSNATQGELGIHDGRLTGAINISPTMVLLGIGGVVAVMAMTKHQGVR